MEGWVSTGIFFSPISCIYYFDFWTDHEDDFFFLISHHRTMY